MAILNGDFKKMNNRNCINCGAPIDNHADKCAYCGTLYYDFCGLSIDGKTPIAFRVKLDDKLVANFLAIPTAASLELKYDNVNYVAANGAKLGSVCTGRTLVPNIDFRVIQNQKGELFTITERISR